MILTFRLSTTKVNIQMYKLNTFSVKTNFKYIFFIMKYCSPKKNCCSRLCI